MDFLQTGFKSTRFPKRYIRLNNEKNLLKEGIKSKKILIVGNTISDSIKYFEKKLFKSSKKHIFFQMIKKKS